MVFCVHVFQLNMAPVTTKMATPLSSDSELTDAQLESHRRATKALEERGMQRGMPLRPED